MRGQRDGNGCCLQDSALEALLAHALLRYLAIAHFGRRSGDGQQRLAGCTGTEASG